MTKIVRYAKLAGVGTLSVIATALILEGSKAPPRLINEASAETTTKPAPKAAKSNKPQAQSEKPAAPTPAAAPAAAADPKAQSPFVVVEQAKAVGAACLPALNDLAKITLDTTQTSMATWNKAAPGQRSFSALNFLEYQNQPNAPRAVALMNVSPTKDDHCDATNIRVQPSKLSCDEISANLMKQGSPAPEKYGDTKLFAPLAVGQRIALLPAATTGCVVISTGVYYGP